MNNIMMVDLQKKGFSWKRVGLIVDYYLPLLRKQIIWYPTAIAAIFLIVYACQFMGDTIAQTSISLLGATSFMIYWSPLILCRYDDRVVLTQLPVTAAEKWLVFVGYFFIVVPILVYGVVFSLSGLVMWLTPEHEFYIAQFDKYKELLNMAFITRFYELLPTALCLWAAFHFKDNRTLKSMLTSGALIVMSGFVGAIYGVLAVLRGFDDAMAGKEPNPDAIATELFQSLSSAFVWVGAISLLIFVIMLILIYRKLKNIQI